MHAVGIKNRKDLFAKVTTAFYWIINSEAKGKSVLIP